MAYEPTIWECGDVVTAEKLNKLEEAVEELSDCCESGGGGGGVMAVHITEKPCPNSEETYMELDKTWQEISDAVSNGILVWLIIDAESGYAVSLLNFVGELHGDAFTVEFVSGEAFLADDANSYPYQGDCDEK